MKPHLVNKNMQFIRRLRGPTTNQVAIFGTSFSGKTVYISMLCHFLDNRDDYIVRYGTTRKKLEGKVFTEEETRTYVLNRQQELTRDHVFPLSTVMVERPQEIQLSIYKVDEKSKKEKDNFILSTYDVPGEAVENIMKGTKQLNEQEKALAEVFINLMTGASGFLFLVDPDPKRAFDQKYMFTVLLEYIASYQGKNDSIKAPIAFVLSKSDMYPIGDPKEYLRGTNMKSVCNLAEFLGDYVGYFKCTSVGATEIKEMKIEEIVVENGERKKITKTQRMRVPSSELRPEGVLEPILWLHRPTK